MTLKVSHASMRSMLDTEAPAKGYTLHLFQNNLLVTRDTVLGDFVQSTFPGYATQNPVWAPSFQNGVEDVAAAAAITFTAGVIVVPETCYGYYFIDNLGNYSWGETFASGPTTIAVTGQTLIIYPQLKMKNYGE